MVKNILKGYYGDIFCEFMVHDKIADTIILLPGFPSSNKLNSEMEFLFKKGYNVFFPRFKGSFQSKGVFLKGNIVKELKSFITKLKKEKITNLWDLNEINFKINKLILFGSSFSGAISCGLIAIEESFEKLVLFSPVWDFENHNKLGNEEDLNHLVQFVKRAYVNLYKIKFDNLVNAVLRFKETSPSFYSKQIKIPILVLNDPKDKIVSIKHSKDMEKLIKNLKIIKHHEGHGFNLKLLENYWKKIDGYLKKV